jgi:hypothetical protein
MKNNNCMGVDQLVVLAAIFSIIIARRLNINEISLASNFFSALGDNLGIIETQIGICLEQQEAENENRNGDNNSNNGSTAEDIEDLQIQINELKKYIKKLENRMQC